MQKKSDVMLYTISPLCYTPFLMNKYQLTFYIVFLSCRIYDKSTLSVQQRSSISTQNNMC